MLEQARDALLILVPRHPQRFETVRELLARRGEAFVNRASGAAIARDRQVLLGDTMGELMMFYAAAAMLFFGAFCMRYRLELILSFPFVALAMALYLRVALKPASAAQQPERLYRERGLMTAVVLAAAVMIVLLRVDLPGMHRFVTPTAPAQYGPGGQ